MIVAAMRYRMRVGCPWRDLPADFGCWNSIYQQFNRWSSKNKVIPESFTAQYNVHMLVYYELHGNDMEAAHREQRFKNWCRKWKLNWIENVNPKWNDLYEEICR
jgi:putative endonuclease